MSVFIFLRPSPRPSWYSVFGCEPGTPPRFGDEWPGLFRPVARDGALICLVRVDTSIEEDAAGRESTSYGGSSVTGHLVAECGAAPFGTVSPVGRKVLRVVRTSPDNWSYPHLGFVGDRFDVPSCRVIGTCHLPGHLFARRDDAKLGGLYAYDPFTDRIDSLSPGGVKPGDYVQLPFGPSWDGTRVTSLYSYRWLVREIMRGRGIVILMAGSLLVAYDYRRNRLIGESDDVSELRREVERFGREMRA